MLQATYEAFIEGSEEKIANRNRNLHNVVYQYPTCLMINILEALASRRQNAGSLQVLASTFQRVEGSPRQKGKLFMIIFVVVDCMLSHVIVSREFLRRKSDQLLVLDPEWNSHN